MPDRREFCSGFRIVVRIFCPQRWVFARSAAKRPNFGEPLLARWRRSWHPSWVRSHARNCVGLADHDPFLSNQEGKDCFVANFEATSHILAALTFYFITPRREFKICEMLAVRRLLAFVLSLVGQKT